ncbi:hypothetical protein BOTBODRAFT_267520 [Botryobasidium botryosum FD-172 SS1]|uniref:Cytochrome P450 n=1 Tax=Botryobasidium botryosum (strain FD-172 SS1) TaxID=930990 RepID=A0A067MMY4_BOTB1|nr:hypothetical protein BOTBODRAFT_267520 [Botryobasidium botryosum FD-172 SS1]
MATHLDVQKRAQADIDSVIKGNTLSTLEVCKNLPYIERLLKELQRWLPSLPHRLMEDDYYRGYFFPKASIIFARMRPTTKTQSASGQNNLKTPRQQSSIRTNTRLAGREGCADATLYLAVVSMLSVFDISKPLDEHGNEVEPEVTFGTGVVRYAPTPEDTRLSATRAYMRMILRPVAPKASSAQSDLALMTPLS